ncbi:hypothetical protein TKK_0016795 [Trichogramma kaykai]|uniref:Major facilitator superfamily (MFS) profile domain-containing protein n=1 Tax=Trichogramma kaykai TaxID=54128 RepID=A0ABD2W3N7_9HYME
MDSQENEPLRVNGNGTIGANNDNVADSEVSVLHKSGGIKIVTDNNKNKKEAENQPGGWTCLLIIASITGCLGSALPAGYNIGSMGNAASIMKQFCNESVHYQFGMNTPLSETSLEILWSAIVSIFLIGGVTGSLTAGDLADRIGRKRALIVGNIFGILGAILFWITPVSNSVIPFMLGRILVGISGGLATSLLPTYMTEVAPIKLRGAVGVLCQLGITCGVLLGQIAGLGSVLGTKDHWHYMLAAFAPFCIVSSLILVTLLPETPKYLYVVKGKKEDAIKVLSSFRNTDRVLLHKEIDDLEIELTTQSSNTSWTISRLFKEPTLKLPLMLVCFLQLGQQLSGVNAVFYYSNEIFKKADLDVKTSQYATVGTGIINVAMALISVPMMSRFGRRTLFLVSASTSIACLLVLSASVAMIDVSFMKWICMAAVLAFVLFYGIGLGPIPYFIGSELFDVGPRSAAMSVGSMCNWGGNFIVGMTFTLLQKYLGWGSFFFFIFCTLMLALFCRIYMPETRGKPTHEIAESVSYGLHSRPNIPSTPVYPSV